MANVTIMQGDEYPLRIKITQEGQPLDVENIEIVEIAIGQIRRKYPNTVYYDSTSGEFIVQLTQEETFKFDGSQKMQIRVKFKDSQYVVGEELPVLSVKTSTSKEVL